MGFTFRGFIAQNSPSDFLADLSGAYYGVTLGTVGDTMAECLARVLLMPWLAEEESPDDVLPLVGAEVRLPRYQLETADQYRARLLNCWEIYDNAGTHDRINAEIAAAGRNGTVLFQPGEPGPNLEPAPYWSQFWILTTETTTEGVNEVFAIARKWKSVYWRLRGFLFDVPITLPAPIAFGDLATFGEGTFG